MDFVEVLVIVYGFEYNLEKTCTSEFFKDDEVFEKLTSVFFFNWRRNHTIILINNTQEKIMQNQIHCHLHAKNTCEINKLLISVI